MSMLYCANTASLRWPLIAMAAFRFDPGTAPTNPGADKPTRPPTGASGSKPEDPTRSAHLEPSQPREDATCERSPRCELASDGLGVGHSRGTVERVSSGHRPTGASHPSHRAPSD